MKWIGSLIILAGVFTQVQPSRISLDDDAQAMCKKYKMICKTGKICAVQHFDYPNNVTFPVCIPLSFVPDEYDHVVRNMVCELQPLPGPCGARYIRWYYNKHAQDCAYFRYGGCQGNQNNFKSRKDCASACMVPSISLYKGSQSSLSAVKPAVITAPAYEPPDLKYEALNSIILTPDNENNNNYDRYSASRYRKMQDDESNTRKRRRLDKERAKERRRRERRKERKRLKRLRRRQKKLLREGKKNKKDRKKKKKKTEEKEVVNEPSAENSVTAENQVNTVEEISNIVDNAIADEDSEQKRRRGDRRDRKRRKKRQKRPKKNKDGRSKKQKRDNKQVETQYRRHAPSYQSDDSRSYKMLSILDHIANSRTQSGSIVYSEH